MAQVTACAKQVPAKTDRVLNVVDPGLVAKMQEFRLRLSVINSGYPVLTDWHPVVPEGWGEFPQVPVRKTTVYKGNEASWAYSHHQTITKFRDKYVLSWSNGFLHEDYVGQEVHYAWSSDGMEWSEPRVLVHTPVESRLVRNNAGLCSADGRLYCYVCVAKDFGRDVAEPGMCSLVDQHIHLDVYSTEDLIQWQHEENICDSVYLFEGPRKTMDGKYMCCGFNYFGDHQAMVLGWDDASALGGPPHVTYIDPSEQGVLPEQGTWYETDDGRIWMYQRDSSESCRLGLTWSDDGGRTWSELLRTDFPNSYSRAFAGRLNDGRCYIVGNNYDIMLDRMHLLVALSDDGYCFDRQYLLVEGDTTRRINGRHKENGYHYPNCITDGDKLLVTYSVNKEDIEVLEADMSKVK